MMMLQTPFFFSVSETPENLQSARPRSFYSSITRLERPGLRPWCVSMARPTMRPLPIGLQRPQPSPQNGQKAHPLPDRHLPPILCRV